MSDRSEQDVREGREAWARLKDRSRKSWEDWLAVARALRAGREAMMAAAGCRRPFGKIYGRKITEWLQLNGLDDISKPIRYRLNLCLDNIQAIEKWRDGLDDARRAQLAHPDSIWFNFVRNTKVAAKIPPARLRQFDRPKMERGRLPMGRSVRFSQDAIRRAAMALREHWGSNDVFRLAAIALSAAIRCEADVFELIPEEPPARPARRRERAAESGAEALHAA